MSEEELALASRRRERTTTRTRNRPCAAHQRPARSARRRVRFIDYKDDRTLGRFITDHGKILPSRLSGVCARHQRQLSTAIKRARYLAHHSVHPRDAGVRPRMTDPRRRPPIRTRHASGADRARVGQAPPRARGVPLPADDSAAARAAAGRPDDAVVRSGARGVLRSWDGGRADARCSRVAWVALAVADDVAQPAPPSAFYNLVRGWSLLLAGSFGLVCLFGDRRGRFFARALLGARHRRWCSRRS